MQCAATGLSLSLSLGVDGRAKGGIERLLGEGAVRVATLAGSYAGQITVDMPDWSVEGKPFDALYIGKRHAW